MLLCDILTTSFLLLAVHSLGAVGHGGGGMPFGLDNSGGGNGQQNFNPFSQFSNPVQFGNQGQEGQQNSNPFWSQNQNPFNFFQTPWNQNRFGNNDNNPQTASPPHQNTNSPQSPSPSSSPSGVANNPYTNWPFASNPWNNNNNNNNNNPGMFNPWSAFQNPNPTSTQQKQPETGHSANPTHPFQNLFPNMFNQNPSHSGQHQPNVNPHHPNPHHQPTTTNQAVPNPHHPSTNPNPVNVNKEVNNGVNPHGTNVEPQAVPSAPIVPPKVVDEAGPVLPGPSEWKQVDDKPKVPVVDEAGPVLPGPSEWKQVEDKPKNVDEAGPVLPGPSEWVQEGKDGTGSEGEDGVGTSDQEPVVQDLDARIENGQTAPKGENKYTDDYLIFN